MLKTVGPVLNNTTCWWITILPICVRVQIWHWEVSCVIFFSIVLVYELNVSEREESLFAIHRTFPLSIQVHSCY